jgi:hypothetical protein
VNGNNEPEENGKKQHGSKGPPLQLQWQPQPPPQHVPPPPLEEPDEDFAEAPATAELKTESWMVAFLLEHLGQEISCWRLITIFSNWDLQSSQMYS